MQICWTAWEYGCSYPHLVTTSLTIPSHFSFLSLSLPPSIFLSLSPCLSPSLSFFLSLSSLSPSILLSSHSYSSGTSPLWSSPGICLSSCCLVLSQLLQRLWRDWRPVCTRSSRRHKTSTTKKSNSSAVKYRDEWRWGSGLCIKACYMYLNSIVTARGVSKEKMTFWQN